MAGAIRGRYSPQNTTSDMGDPNNPVPNTGPGGHQFDAATGTWVKQSPVNQTDPRYAEDQYQRNKRGADYQSMSAMTGLGNMGASMFGAGTPYTPPAQVQGPVGTATIQMGAAPERIGREGGPGNVANIRGPNMDAANAAIFARAKDKAGLTARSALTGLAGAMAGRGIVGSGVEGRGIQGVIGQGQQQLGDTIREQAINEAALQEQNALASYQGDITQRGQNINSLDTQRGQDVTQRGQDISNLQAANNSLVTQRGQDQALAGLQYQGGITQRGQDIGSSQFEQDLDFRKKMALAGLSKGMY